MEKKSQKKMFNESEEKYTKKIKLVGWLFYGISTIIGYLMPNHVYTYIFNRYL